MTRSLLALLLLSTVMSASPGLPQEGLPSPVSPSAVFFESVNVEVATIDVFVTDNKGRPVTGLAKEDFRLFENGRSVPLTNFLAVGAEESIPDEPGDAALVSRTGGQGEGLAAPRSERLYLGVFVDQMSLRPQDRNRVLGELEEFLRREIGPEMRVLVASHLRSLEVRQGFTEDPDLVSRALGQLAAESGLAIERENERRRMIQLIREAGSAEGVRERLYQYAEAVQNDTESSLRALSQLIASMPGIEGRKAILWVGGGLPSIAAEDLFTALVVKFADAKPLITMRGYNSESWIREVTRQANANRVTIYALDASGARPPSTSSVTEAEHAGRFSTQLIDSIYDQGLQKTLVGLSEETGGRAILGANRVTSDLQRLARDFGTYYSLGYQPAASGSGEYREIRVEVARQGVRIRHRRGYLDRTLATRMTDGTRASLLHGTGDNLLGLELRVTAQGAANQGEFLASMELAIPLGGVVLLPGESFHEGRLRLYVGAVDERGDQSEVREDEVPIRIPSEEVEPARQSSFVYRGRMRLGPGRHTIAVGVWDEFGHSASYVTSSLELGI